MSEVDDNDTYCVWSCPCGERRTITVPGRYVRMFSGAVLAGLIAATEVVCECGQRMKAEPYEFDNAWEARHAEALAAEAS